jgi:hypothetical protein
MGVDAPSWRFDDKGEKAGFEKGAEERPRYPLLVRTHRAPREGRPISEQAIAWRLSRRVVGRRDRGVENLASTRCVIAVSVLGQGRRRCTLRRPLHFSIVGPTRYATGTCSDQFRLTVRAVMPDVRNWVRRCQLITQGEEKETETRAAR